MNLVRAEWRRFFARRFTRLMVVTVLVILGLIGLGVAGSTQQPGPGAVAEAERIAAEQRAQIAEARRQCEAAQSGSASGGSNEKFGQLPPGETCATMFRDDHATAENFMPNVFSFRDEAPAMLMVFGGVLALFAFAVGASFIGAEWSSGGIMNLLLWRPRRVPVLTGKLVTLLAAVTATWLVLVAGWVALLWGIAAFRGRTGTITSGVVQSMALTSLRSLALVLAAAVVGFGVASLGRNTATALGVAVGYVVVLEIGTRIVLEIAEVIKPERWFLSSYAVAWLNKKVTFNEWRHCRYDTTGSCESYAWTIDMSQAALVFGAILMVVLGTAFLAFRRRDVT
ncbi:MAG TPA: ABC transporter permease subunit [Micromonosporaceae bacterium]|nr:ABC transporter permease subunit [Micromonosporaceae bacterium]